MAGKSILVEPLVPQRLGLSQKKSVTFCQNNSIHQEIVKNLLPLLFRD